LFYAERSERHLEMISLLLRLGAVAHTEDYEAQNVLFWCYEYPDALKLYLRLYSWNLSAQCTRGFTVLHRAAMDGIAESVSLLLDEGVDFELLESALLLARRHGHVEVVHLLEDFMHGSWTRHAHRLLLDISIAVVALELPTWIVLWIVNFLPTFARQQQDAVKIRLIEHVRAFRMTTRHK